MATILTGTGITFPDSTTYTTAPRKANTATTVDIQTFTGGQTTSTSGSGTWTKPTGGQTTAQIEIWGGGAGSTATAGCAGGYTIFRVPVGQLPSTITVNAPSNVGSLSGGTGVSANVAGVTGTGWLGVANTLFSATGGALATPGTGYLFSVTTNTGGSGGGASAGGIWGGAAASAGSNGNSPGGGAASGTHYGGSAQVRITCW